VHTFCPNAPKIDIKEKHRVMFSDENGKDVFPFFSFVTEIKDKGFYSPRGIPEQVAPFESSLCKCGTKSTIA